MSKYPLIKAMGLYVEKIHDDEAAGGKFFVVYAAELERALEKAPVVQSISSTPDSDWSGFSAGRSITHTARLLCVQPAKAPDTAESLLREALDELSAPYFRPHDLHPRLQLVLERSRRPFGGQVTDLIQQLGAWADAQAIKSPYKQTYDRCRLREGAQGVLDLLAPVIAAADELIGQDEVNAPRGQWERVIADLRAKLGEK